MTAPRHHADLDRLETWLRYKPGLCAHCRATCCTMPVEVRVRDLVRMGLVDPFEAEHTPPKAIAKRLIKARVVAQFNHKHAVFTLAQRANGDCLYLDGQTRRCTVYADRPDTCRNHPQIGPRPGFCAYQLKVVRPCGEAD
jgi:hypothetical protein